MGSVGLMHAWFTQSRTDRTQSLESPRSDPRRIQIQQVMVSSFAIGEGKAGRVADPDGAEGGVGGEGVEEEGLSCGLIKGAVIGQGDSLSTISHLVYKLYHITSCDSLPCALIKDLLVVLHRTLTHLLADNPNILTLMLIRLHTFALYTNQIAADTLAESQQQHSHSAWFSIEKFSISNSKDTFTAIGCDTSGSVQITNKHSSVVVASGCQSKCSNIDSVPNDGSCLEIGCCQTSIPKGFGKIKIYANSFSKHTGVTDFNPCSHAFVIEECELNFSTTYLKKFKENMVPVVPDWGIGNGFIIGGAVDIGIGTGEINLGSDQNEIRGDKRIVAIRKSKVVDESQVEQFINEIVVLSQINHPNVVKLVGCCLDTQIPLLVYEFITNASVPIIHRDVKTTNILLDGNYTTKLSDFRASRLVPKDKIQFATVIQGTLGYLDPEYLQTSQLTEKSDVYSFEVVLAELVTGKKALAFDRPEEERCLATYFLSSLKTDRLNQAIDKHIENVGETVEQLKKVADIAERCLKLKMEERPTMKDVAMELERLIMKKMGNKHPQVETNIDVISEETERTCLVRRSQVGMSLKVVVATLQQLSDENIQYCH
ncbi:hypothetical protein TEA_023753 [Camellia sinensis var. sinensis]|uniref:Protein kinase domain-containing protein n=1 Tax=Camellia sinensis var. sinensis TaxID=542762 RepID=A0A4V3WJL1_CAMSN|nr:hypothetical protein TEA_023753 [Camellia sinensis var. sinensis]